MCPPKLSKHNLKWTLRSYQIKCCQESVAQTACKQIFPQNEIKKKWPSEVFQFEMPASPESLQEISMQRHGKSSECTQAWLAPVLHRCGLLGSWSSLPEPVQRQRGGEEMYSMFCLHDKPLILPEGPQAQSVSWSAAHSQESCYKSKFSHLNVNFNYITPYTISGWSILNKSLWNLLMTFFIYVSFFSIKNSTCHFILFATFGVLGVCVISVFR